LLEEAKGIDMDSRVFWGVLCALLVFSGLVAVGAAIRQRAAEQAAAEAFQQFLKASADPDPMGLRREAARRRAEDLQRRRLTSGEQCIGGTVVNVSGSSYVQITGAGGRPVRCSGQYRLQ
jgi:hypothetical protein